MTVYTAEPCPCWGDYAELDYLRPCWLRWLRQAGALLAYFLFVVMLTVSNEGIASGSPWLIEKAEASLPSAFINIRIVDMPVNIHKLLPRFCFLKNVCIGYVDSRDFPLASVDNFVTIVWFSSLENSVIFVNIPKIIGKNHPIRQVNPVYMNVNFGSWSYSEIFVVNEQNIWPYPADRPSLDSDILFDVISKDQLYLLNSHIRSQLPPLSIDSIADQVSRRDRQTNRKQPQHHSKQCDNYGRNCNYFFVAFVGDGPNVEEPDFERGVRGGALILMGLFAFGCFAVIFWWVLTR